VSGLFVGGDVGAMLAVARRLDGDAGETGADARRLADRLAGIAPDVVLASALSPVDGARVAARAAVAEGGLLALAARSLCFGQLLTQHGRMLQEASMARMLGGGLVHAALFGAPKAIEMPKDLRELRSERVGGAAGFGAGGVEVSVRIVEAVDGQGRKVWLVSSRRDLTASATAGASVNGMGERVEAVTGGAVTTTWAFASLDDARTAVALLLPGFTEPTFGQPATVAGHRLASVAAVTPVGGAELQVEVTNELSADGSRALEIAAIGSAAFVVPPPALLPAGGAGRMALRIEAPARSPGARVVLSVESDRPTGAGTGWAVVDAGNHEVERTTTTLEVELTDADDVAAARRLAEMAPEHVTKDDLAAARRLFDRVDLSHAPREVDHATGVVQHSDASVSAGMGVNAGVDVEIWESRPEPVVRRVATATGSGPADSRV
jgi:hypothetical protein